MSKLLSWIFGNKVMLILGALLIVSTIASARIALKRHEEVVRLSERESSYITRINQLAAERASLSDAHQMCMAEIEVAGEDQRASLKVIEGLAERLKKDQTDVRIEREEIYRTPGCAELADLDIAVACPALATSLRISADRARRADSR